MNLNNQVASIESREDLVNFIRSLAADAKANSHEWSSNDLPAYLEALSGWLGDMDGFFENRSQPVPATPNWQLLGQALLAAKYYE